MRHRSLIMQLCVKGARFDCPVVFSLSPTYIANEDEGKSWNWKQKQHTAHTTSYQTILGNGRILSNNLCKRYLTPSTLFHLCIVQQEQGGRRRRGASLVLIITTHIHHNKPFFSPQAQARLMIADLSEIIYSSTATAGLVVDAVLLI
jgi:hypothetical protein